jgi:electron transfer flavoprotein alpha/beta subunit
MGDVISVDGGARDPRVPTLFQIADVDSGEIRWVNADCVTHVVPRC